MLLWLFFLVISEAPGKHRARWLVGYAWSCHSAHDDGSTWTAPWEFMWMATNNFLGSYYHDSSISLPLNAQIIKYWPNSGLNSTPSQGSQYLPWIPFVNSENCTSKNWEQTQKPWVTRDYNSSRHQKCVSANKSNSFAQLSTRWVAMRLKTWCLLGANQRNRPAVQGDC